MPSEIAAQAIRETGVCDGLDPTVNELLATVGLVDHHVHGVVAERMDDARLADLLVGSPGSAVVRAAAFDTQVWHAVRRWCAPQMRAPAHIAAEDYLVARRAYERLIPIGQLLLRRAGLERVIVEAALDTQGLTSAGETAALAGAKASRVARLEQIAERLVVELADPASWPDAFRRAVADEHAGHDAAVGFTTDQASRGGFDRDLSRPPDEAVAAAAVRWSGAVRGGARARLADDVLLRFSLWTALDTGLPLQVHVGGPDADPRRADPRLLAELVRAADDRAPVVLLGTYPFHRGAGTLARRFPSVHVDVGPVLAEAGAASEALLRESMELAPFTKLVFGSSALGAPELHLLGSWLFRRAMSRVLGDWVARGDWSRDDAERAIRLVAAENARRIYRVPS